MTDLICRKTMMRCQAPGMCSPFGGCQPSVLADCKTTQSNTSAAPRQPDWEGLEVVAWQDADNPLYTTAERRQMHGWATDGYPIVELCRLSDAQRAIAELREECERLRVKLMTIASAEPGRHNIEWAKAMAATGNNAAYAKWREAFDQRDKLAEILRDIVPGCKWKHMRPRIDAALAEIDHDNE